MRPFSKLFWFWFAVLLSLTSLRSLAAAQDAQSTRRFALLVGANQGGKGRAVLRYAQRDARAVAEVLEQLGGVERKDRVLLLEPSPQQLLLALSQFEPELKRARENGQRTELLFYYSGHSDEQGLLLGEERVTYRDLRAALASVSASVHVGVLDSCASGALTRLKGGERRAPFLLDHSNAVQGHAFLTSASADEGAQESDRVGASYFTHYLVSGLRGAADFSGDGRVTLNEAYRFAFDETLARTEGTHAGPQHASYDIQLVGTGDLVMTDLRQTAAALSIPKDVSGRMYLRDTSGNLVVELNKPAGRAVELALDAQSYQILLDQGGKLSRASVTLPAYRTTVLRMESFVAVEGERNRLRGDVLVKEECKNVPIGVGLFPPASTNSRYRFMPESPCIKNNFALHLVWGRSDKLTGFAMGIGGTQVQTSAQGAQVAVGINLTKELSGAQVAVGANFTEQMYGAQFGVGPNIVSSEYYGGQFGLINLAQKARGVQFGLVNGAFALGGVQAGLVNLTGRTSGLQAGLVNLTTVKDSGSFQGGLVNVHAGESSRGLQFGLVNVAAGHLRGGQVGLVNYADKTKSQVGLVSITRDGGVHGIAYTTNAVPFLAGVRFDADYTFALLTAGVTTGEEIATLAYGFGFGGKIPLVPRLWLEPMYDGQYLAYNGKFENASTVSRVSVNVRYAFRNRFSVFGGPAFQVLIHTERDSHGQKPGYTLPTWELTNGGASTQVLGSLGLTAGLVL